MRVIYDPYTTVVDAAGRVTRTPFPGNKIPADRIESAGPKNHEQHLGAKQDPR